jgi:hypothetical protein
VKARDEFLRLPSAFADRGGSAATGEETCVFLPIFPAGDMKRLKPVAELLVGLDRAHRLNRADQYDGDL